MTYQFTIQVKGYKNPEVWRRIETPANFTFYQFQKAIEIAFRKEATTTLYTFSPSGNASKPLIMSIPPFFAESDYTKTTFLSSIFNHQGQTFVYAPDAEETLLHSIILERIDSKEIPFPRCLEGEGAYPPETCAGPEDYEEMKQILANKNHPQHEIIREWLELGDFETWEEKQKLDVSKVNELLTQIDADIKAFRNYKIKKYDTFDELYGLTPSLWKEIDRIRDEINTKANLNLVMRKLKRLIEQYPAIPHFKNSLATVYSIKEENKLYLETLQSIILEYPNYTMAKGGLIHHYLEENQLDKASELLGKNFDLNELYPNRNGEFTDTEIMNYHIAVIQYLIKKEDYIEAEKHFNYLECLAPNALYLDRVRMPLIFLRMSKSLQNVVKEKTVVVIPETVMSTENKPDFENPEIWVFYQKDQRIKRDYLHRILSLPRESVIRDMEKILIDSIARIDYYNDNSDSETTFAPIHAMSVLSQLQAEEALDTLFTTFRQDKDYYDFWYGILLTEQFWRFTYMMGKNRIDRLKDFMCEPNRHTYIRTSISLALEYIAYYQPERRDEVLRWYEQVIQYMLDNQNDENVFEKHVYTSLLHDMIDVAGREHFPLILRLYDKNLTEKNQYLTLHELKRRLSKPFNVDRKIFTTIDEYYDRWMNYFSKEEEIKVDNKQKDTGVTIKNPPKVKPDLKIGRNELCPCGSGKKYKKCCGS